MADINRDIDILIKTMNGNEVYQEFNHIYPRTTENIAGILEMVDVEDMDVYAVLSSSDIPFSLIDKRVKSIETFDINPLTLRYYYLRKWMLENGILDGKDISYGDIRDIINSSRRYINKDEESSVKFWNVYIDGLNKTFFNLYNAMLFAYVGDRISCCYDDDFSYLLEYLNKISLVFGEIDLASASEEYPSKKYDLVYLSNIMDLKDRLSVQKLCKRVDAMLNSGGQVICTNLVNHPYFDFFKEQKGIFEKKFVYDELFRERIGSTYNVYYRYIKK